MDAIEIERGEGHAGALELVVMTIGAVLIEEGALRGGCGKIGGGL
jgi:hypothetical protein